MRLEFDRVETRCDRGAVVVDDAFSSVVNEGAEPARVVSVAAVYRVVDATPPIRMFRHGYQSWSPTGVAVFGVDEDPSRADGSISLVRDMHHADPSTAEAGELRSEWVTVLADNSHAPSVRGAFATATDHDGTFRLRDRVDGPELWVEAYFGGAEIAPGDARSLHPFAFVEAGDPCAALDSWAATSGDSVGARIDAPYQVGWCSWYHYFDRVTEDDLRANLARAAEWPFAVFQLDDGYQAAIGDWTETNDKFPSTLAQLGAAIAAEGRVPGLWLAPFLCAPDSSVAREHPDWIARHRSGRPLVGGVNDHWGGFVHVLDTSRPEVQEHLEQLGAALVQAGFPYLKLDFTYAPGLAGEYADVTMTPAQRLRAGFDAFRRGAGDDAFLLGCGAPLAATAGTVDGMRIGPDVAPCWHRPADAWAPPGYAQTAPATVNAWRNTLSRSFLHRRLWLNDPDCVMLRSSDTALATEQARAWALAVGASGGMALVSDDLSLIDADGRALFDDVLALGREVDEAATAGAAPRCSDLLDHDPPRLLETEHAELVGNPEAGTATLQTRM